MGGQSVPVLGETACMTGGVVPTTVTVVLATAVLPDASTAVNRTIVRPGGKMAGALDVTLTAAQLSVAIAAVNREELRRQWQREPPPRARRARRRPRHD